MGKNRYLLERRNQKIAQEYAHKFFAEGKRDEVIYEELCEKWYLRPETLKKIVMQACKAAGLESK